jgi:hypothetical protein
VPALVQPEKRAKLVIKEIKAIPVILVSRVKLAIQEKQEKPDTPVILEQPEVKVALAILALQAQKVQLVILEPLAVLVKTVLRETKAMPAKIAMALLFM